MPPLVVPGTVRANLIWTLSGNDYAVNVLHYLVPPGQVINATAAADYAGDVGSAFAGAAIATELSDLVSLARVTLRDLRTASLPEFGSTVTADGADTSDLLPLMCSLCVTLRTNKAGRRYRGRIYLPGWCEAANTSTGEASSAAQTAALAFVNDLAAVTVTTNSWTLGVMSTVDLDTNAVISAEVRDATWDTQRRRSRAGI